MAITFQLSPTAGHTCAAVSDHARQVAAHRAWPVGVCEMAAGAAVLTAGLASRTLQLGVDLVLQPLGPGPLQPAPANATCVVLGLLPLLMLQKTGIAGAGPALALPALALLDGGGVLLGLGGCGPAAQARQFLDAVPQHSAALASGAQLAVGIALLVQGAQRLAPRGDAQPPTAHLDAGLLQLPTLPPAHQAITTWTGLAAYANDLGALATPLGPSLAGAAPSAEHGFILRALQARASRSSGAGVSGFGLSQAGAEAE